MITVFSLKILVAKGFGNVQKCMHDVDRDCGAHFRKTFSKRNGVGGQIDTVSQKTF
jgi:hypothetical protein